MKDGIENGIVLGHGYDRNVRAASSVGLGKGEHSLEEGGSGRHDATMDSKAYSFAVILAG